MAASSNDSFGLKIATALSIALTVVLLISVYFLNSSYNQEFERAAKNQQEITKLNTQIRDETNKSNTYRELMGYAALEDFETAKAAIKKDNDQIGVEIAGIVNEVDTMVGEFQKKAEAKGIDASQYDALRARAKELVDAYAKNPDQSYKASLTRLKDLTVNQAKLTTALALNYIDIRRDLELANKINDEQRKAVEAGLAKARAELEETIKKDEAIREEVVKSDRDKADKLAALETQMTNTINDLTTKGENREKVLNGLRAVLADLRDIQAQKEDVMSKPGGRVTFVDYSSKVVRVSVNASQGVRPLMRFTVFDKNSVGITSDKPKAAIELTRVGDPSRGENDSLGRIVQTFEPNDPIRYNDYIFSVGWNYDHPQRFDLIGKLDMNRDGKDDRADLIRMIEAAGGVVEFDLPPPGVDRSVGQAAVARAYKRLGEPVPASTGRASGKISGSAFAYVTDRRPSLALWAKRVGEPTKDDTTYLQEESAATKEARDNFVRPLPLEKLLNMLGYDFQNPLEGRREAVDRPSIKSLLKAKPKSREAEPTPPSDSTTPPPADEPK